MSKGFDIRAFRIKQAQIREREERSKAAKKGGLGQFTNDDNFGVKMPSMNLDKAEDLVIDQEKIISNLNDEEFIRRDEEQALTKRTTFAFGGESVRDRIKKRKMNAKIGNEVQKLERIIKTKKGEVNHEEDQDDSEEDANNKRQKR